MTTAAAILRSGTAELKVLGVGQSLSADNLKEGLDKLNDVLDTARNEQLLAFADTTTQKVLTADRNEFTVGPGQDFDIPRPNRFELGSFSRYGGITDRPLECFNTQEWAAIWNKEAPAGYPSIYNYELNADNVTGRLNFWPRSDATVFMVSRVLLLRFANVNQDVTLAPGYKEWLVFEAACAMAGIMQVDLDPATELKRRALRKKLKGTKVQVPQMDMPLDIAGGSSAGRFDILGGSFR